MGLLRSTAVFSSMTFISRITGLVRDVVFAAYFEFGKATDAFLIAFKIPNFLRRLFAEGAFSQAFVPVLSEYKVKREAEDVKELVAATAGTLGIILLLLTTLVVLVTPLFVMLIALGYIGDPAQVDLTAQMLRITFPYIFFISLTALAGGVLNTYGRFALPAFTPVLLNLSLIGAAIWLSDYFTVPAMALAWGVLIAGIVQLLLQLPFLMRLKLLHWPRWGWHDPGVRRIMKLMLPGLIGSSAMQINLLFDVMVASFLAFGSITWLYFADRMMEFPLGMFGIALATVILPHLSEKFARQDSLAFSRTLDWALRWVLIIGLPAAVGLGVLAGPILATLFLHGDKTIHDLQMMSLALVAYSFGLLGFMLVKVLVPGYFARQDTKTPMKVRHAGQYVVQHYSGGGSGKTELFRTPCRTGVRHHPVFLYQCVIAVTGTVAGQGVSARVRLGRICSTGRSGRRINGNRPVVAGRGLADLGRFLLMAAYRSLGLVDSCRGSHLFCAAVAGRNPIIAISPASF